jgi:uncharacterized membrane protein YkvA (DUF1232 family)
VLVTQSCPLRIRGEVEVRTSRGDHPAYRGGVTELVVVGAVVAALWAFSCIVAVLLAHRLSPGVLRQVAEFLPACVTTARRLRRNPDVPRRAKLALLVAIAWVVSPIDLLPEFLPVIGPLDDVVAVVLLLRYAARAVPRATLLDAWPSDPTLLERLLGGREHQHRPGRAGPGDAVW